MSISLHPVTREKLDQVARRRRRLVLTRGVCAAVVSFLLLMSSVALADWRWVLSDGWRWGLSASGYAGVLAAVWWTSLRWIVRGADSRDLARRVEAAEPELRESLLSAVELSGEGAGAIYDSPVFRRLLQDRVGRRMGSLEVGSLLPLKLVASWLAGAALLVLVCGTLLTVPGLPYRQLMIRAILPGANIDRVSRVQVTILQPSPPSLTLPEEETAAVIVLVSGGKTDKVILETHTANAGVRRDPMHARGASQFAANLTVGKEPIEYRVLAGDAVTRKYTIRSRPRPAVLAFHKTYRFPGYAGLEAATVTEPHGDLAALEGTEADLVLEVNQEVAEAEIRLEPSGAEEPRTIALAREGENRLRGTLPLTAPAVYSIHLVARETGFENTFSPKYEIRPQPDAIPRAGFVDQQETTLLLPRNDLLPLKGLAEDDLPLVSLEQLVSVNGGEWQRARLEIEAAPRATAAWDWDLAKLGLKSGDQVLTKLVATDRKGNAGESVPLEIVISPDDFDPRRHAAMELKAGLYDKLAELAKTVEECQAAANALADRLTRPDQDPQERAAARAELLDLAGKVREEADNVLQQIVRIIPQMPSGADAQELELGARNVGRIEHEFIQIAALCLDASSSAADAELAAEDVTRIRKAFADSAEQARRVEARFRDLVTHNILAAIALDLDGLLRYQRQILAPGAVLSWQRLVRQETVAMGQLRTIERLIGDNLARVRASTQPRVQSILEWAPNRRERLEASMESEDQAERLRETAHSLLRELEGRQSVANLDSRLASSLVEARKELDTRAGSGFLALERLARAAEAAPRLADQAAASDDSAESGRLLEAAKRAAAEQRQFESPSLAQLKTRRSATQSRRDGDPQYAADAGLTSRAVRSLLDQYAAEQSAQPEVAAVLARIAPAYRILETGHEAAQLGLALSHLVSLERWDSQKIAARLDHPRQWDAVQEGLAVLGSRLKEAGFAPEVAAEFKALHNAARAQGAARIMGARRYREESPAGAVDELAELETRFNGLLEQIQPMMAQARALIAQYAPTIPQMAQRAGQDVRELQQQSVALADEKHEAASQTAEPSISRLQEEQREADDRIGELTEALIDDANTQDLLTEEGRQRARDADDSVAMVREPAARANQALGRAAAADRQAERSRELAQAAEAQHRTAEALDLVARHYGRLESGEDVAQTREALREAEREMGIVASMDEPYAQAEQLAAMAGKSPQELLDELEAELSRNPPMREELSDISRDAVQQARNSLEQSAEEEEAMRRSIERSDQQFRGKKNDLVKQLRDLGQGASDLGKTLVAQADSALSRQEAPEARQRLQQAQGDLFEAAVAPRRAGEDSPLDDVLRTAREMADRLGAAAQELSDSRELLDQATQKPLPVDEPQRAERRREFEAGAKRFHEQRLRGAKEAAANRQRALKQAADQVAASETALRTAESQIDEARRDLEQNPANRSARRKWEQVQTKQAKASESLQRARERLEQARKEAVPAQQAVERLQQQEIRPLTSPNPGAEMALRFATEAAETAKELAQRAKELAGEPDWSDSLRADPNQLKQAAAQQQEVGEEVSRASEDVARAGRHEERLGKPVLAGPLADRARGIQGVARQEVAGSERQLAAASEAENANQERNSPPPSIAARDSVKEAQDAISREADALGAILSPPSPAATAAQAPQAAGDQEARPADASASSPPSPAEAARAKLLARTLDELDLALATSQPSAQPSGPPQSGLSGLAQAARDQAASLAQSRAQSRPPADGVPSFAQAVESASGAAIVDTSDPDFSVAPVHRQEPGDWGKLRAQSAEDLTEGRREAVSAEYRKQVETYFRVIAERARQEK